MSILSIYMRMQNYKCEIKAIGVSIPIKSYLLGKFNVLYGFSRNRCVKIYMYRNLLYKELYINGRLYNSYRITLHE